MSCRYGIRPPLCLGDASDNNGFEALGEKLLLSCRRPTTSGDILKRVAFPGGGFSCGDCFVFFFLGWYILLLAYITTTYSKC